MSSIKVLKWLFIVVVVGAFGYFVSGRYKVGPRDARTSIVGGGLIS